MINAVCCNMPSFKQVEFGPGFNVILADRTKESTRRDSRNGLGKTTLIEILHFCLGAQARKNQGLMVAPLQGWEFTLDISIDDRHLLVTRSTENPSRIDIQGDIQDWPWPGERRNGKAALRANDWNAVLSVLMFGLSTSESFPKYHPTFRSLASYFIRRGREGFASPFVHHRRQQEWDKQVNNAYLLGLEWKHASQFQELKDQENLLKGLRRAAQEGLLEGMLGTIGNLEAERARLDSEIRRQFESLRNFRVHPRYREIEQEANNLTLELHQLSNANLAEGRLIDLYRISIQEEQEPETEELLKIYRTTGVIMPNLVRRRLNEVKDFHRQIVANRQVYLQSEMQRIENNINQREIQLQEKSERRAQLLEVLRTHGALEEHTRLQELYLELVGRRDDIGHRITNLRSFEQGRSEIRVKRELLLQTARRDFEERLHAREQVINLFNSNSEALYNAPGNLVVDIGRTGFKFDVEILRSGSQGIDNMKIFCYDLMLAQLWSSNTPAPGLLVHDSTIFDGVDERQKAEALELAQRETHRLGFQYLCALNSDTLPDKDFSPQFKLDRYVRLRLTDESEAGGLLGIRY